LPIPIPIPSLPARYPCLHLYPIHILISPYPYPYLPLSISPISSSICPFSRGAMRRDRKIFLSLSPPLPHPYPYLPITPYRSPISPYPYPLCPYPCPYRPRSISFICRYSYSLSLPIHVPISLSLPIHIPISFPSLPLSLSLSLSFQCPDVQCRDGHHLLVPLGSMTIVTIDYQVPSIHI
jgi:hypothetical protein